MKRRCMSLAITILKPLLTVPIIEMPYFFTYIFRFLCQTILDFLRLLISFSKVNDSNMKGELSESCTSDDNDDNETESTSNESTVPLSSTSMLFPSCLLSISPEPSSPESNTTSWDEQQINLKVGEIEGYLDKILECLSDIEIHIDQISLRELADCLKCQEMQNVITLIDVTYDLAKCTRGPARRIRRST